MCPVRRVDGSLSSCIEHLLDEWLLVDKTFQADDWLNAGDIFLLLTQQEFFYGMITRISYELIATVFIWQTSNCILGHIDSWSVAQMNPPRLTDWLKQQYSKRSRHLTHYYCALYSINNCDMPISLIFPSIRGLKRFIVSPVNIFMPRPTIKHDAVL